MLIQNKRIELVLDVVDQIYLSKLITQTYQILLIHLFSVIEIIHVKPSLPYKN